MNATIQIGHEEPQAIREWNPINEEDEPPDAGYFFAPYIPLQDSPVLNPNEFQPREVMTRYSPELLREGARYYARLAIEGPLEFEEMEGKRILGYPAHLPYDPRYGF
jgi:hypothetical protein